MPEPEQRRWWERPAVLIPLAIALVCLAIALGVGLAATPAPAAPQAPVAACTEAH